MGCDGLGGPLGPLRPPPAWFTSPPGLHSPAAGARSEHRRRDFPASGMEGCISHEVNHPEGAEGSDAPAEPEPWAWLSQPRHYHTVALTPLCCPCIEGCSVASLASAARSRAPSLLPPRDNRRCLWTLPRCPVGKVTPHLPPYPSRQVTLLEGDEFGEEDGEGHGEGPLQQEVPTYDT